MKKIIIYVLAISTCLTLVISSKDVSAIDFSKKESYYTKLCSSSNLSSSNKKTCEQFNTYLKKKSQQIKEDLKDTQNDINKTKNDIDEVEKQLNEINSKISETQGDINYLQKSINKIEKNIKTKENEMKERLYVMQAYYNSQSLLTFLFSSNGFSDFFSRLNSINDITAYEKDLLNELTQDKKELAKQKETLETAKASLQTQKNSASTLKNKLDVLKKQQQDTLANLKEDQAETEKTKKEVQEALEEMMQQIPSTDSGGNAVMGTQGDAETGYKIAQKAISKIGRPYWWGNNGPNYFDCSGLVYWAHNNAGVKLGRTNANGYARAGRAVAYKNLQAGDIVAFRRSGSSTYHHIGIYIGNGIVVHASGEGPTCQGNHASKGHVVKRTALSSFSNYAKAYRRLY